MNSNVKAVGGLYQKKCCKGGDVFAVDPTHKVKIIEKLRKQSHLVVNPKHLYDLTVGKQMFTKAEQQIIIPNVEAKDTRWLLE